MSTPSTTLHICQVPFANDYQHVVYFATPSEQAAYFLGKRVKYFEGVSQIRKNWEIKIAAKITSAETWNYLYFTQNGKTYYYFIVDVVYISDETVKLVLEMDVMQTYAFDYVLRPCFVEREHADTDGVGSNTVDEGLELGTYVNSQKYTPDLFNGKMSMMMMSTCNIWIALGEYEFDVETEIIDNIVTGCKILRWDLDYSVAAVGDCMGILKKLAEKNPDIIVSMWMYPDALLDIKNPGNPICSVRGAKVGGVEYTVPTKPDLIDGYKPKNNKLLTYPYNYLYATDNKGGTAIYRYERFTSQNPTFVFEGSVFPDGGIKMTPTNYNGTGYNYDESLTLTSLPTCPWVSDTYKIWLAQNQSQQKLGYVTSGISVVGGAVAAIAGAATGNAAVAVGGAVTAYSGIQGIAGQLAQKEDMQKQPPQSHGSASATLNAGLKLYFDFYLKSITAERAKIIDDYFTMYGYKTLRVKIPNRHVRAKFTYTKTENCDIGGAICQSDINKIKAVYNRGVTFWDKDAQIGNYDVDNSII